MFLLHLCFEFIHKVFTNFSNLLLFKQIQCGSLGFLVDFSQFLIKEREFLLVDFVHVFIELSERFMHSLETLVLTDVVPSIFNIRDSSSINGGHIRLYKSIKHLSIDSFSIHHLRFNSIDDFPSELHNLLNKIWSKFFKLHIGQVLFAVNSNFLPEDSLLKSKV